MKQISIFCFFILMLFASQTSLGHPGHKTKKAQSDSIQYHGSQVNQDTLNSTQPPKNGVNEEGKMPPPLAVYPTYHPMVVHAPIVLLILAALLQLFALVKSTRSINALTFVLAAGGAVGAYFAGTLVHPHTDGLSDSAQAVLEVHETYAMYTHWLGIVGTLIKGITIWRPFRWLEGITAIALVGAGITVGLAAHQGGALTYLYGIGPRGAYLEQHEGEHADGHQSEHQHHHN